MIPQVEKCLKLWKPNVTIEKLKQTKLDHFLPAKTARENLLKNIKRREIVSLMHTLQNDPKYGLKPFSTIVKANTQITEVAQEDQSMLQSRNLTPDLTSSHK